MPTSLAVSRLTLLPAGTPRAAASEKVRRYRLARLEPSRPDPTPAPRYAYLKRSYD